MTPKDRENCILLAVLEKEKVYSEHLLRFATDRNDLNRLLHTLQSEKYVSISSTVMGGVVSLTPAGRERVEQLGRFSPSDWSYEHLRNAISRIPSQSGEKTYGSRAEAMIEERVRSMVHSAPPDDDDLTRAAEILGSGYFGRSVEEVQEEAKRMMNVWQFAHGVEGRRT